MVFASAEEAIKPRSEFAKKAAWVYAAIIVVMAVGQLFSFEDFIPLLRDYFLPGGDPTASLVGCLIVFTEVFSIPFLLRMPLSPLMRWVSLVCGVVVPVLWLFVSLWTFRSYELIGGIVAKAGILGTKLSLPNVYQLVMALVLLALAIYVVYGLWPVRQHTSKK
jgi:hypothetical protein